MDDAIIFTGPPGLQDRPSEPPAARRSKADKNIKRYLEARAQLNSAHVDVFRAFLAELRRDTEGLESLGIAGIFAKKVETTLSASELSSIVKRMQLFMLLSYTAALQKLWNEKKSKALESIRQLESEKKKIKKSIANDGLNVLEHGLEIKSRYAALQSRNNIIKGHDTTIGNLALAKEELDKSTKSVMSAMSVVRVNLEENTAEVASHQPSVLGRSALILHRIITALVDEGWTPARATLEVMSRKYRFLHSSRYLRQSRLSFFPLALLCYEAVLCNANRREFEETGSRIHSAPLW